MQYICSDTNVWIDFRAIDKLELPFRLDYTYLMSKDALSDEIRSPQDCCMKLIEMGLQPVDITIQELLLSMEYQAKYRRLSVYDTFALAIAKKRNIALLSGDGPLRKAARLENVTVHGTIWILDQLKDSNRIKDSEFQQVILAFIHECENGRRLPVEELQKRLG